MIAYLPTIYPDELVYSWFCRYYVHSGCFTHKMALQELYCSRSDNPSKEFIGNLKPEARAEIAKNVSAGYADAESYAVSSVCTLHSIGAEEKCSVSYRA